MTGISRSIPVFCPLTLVERDGLWSAMQHPPCWARLHPIEQEIATNLHARPFAAWCNGAHLMFRKLGEKALAQTIAA